MTFQTAILVSNKFRSLRNKLNVNVGVSDIKTQPNHTIIVRQMHLAKWCPYHNGLENKCLHMEFHINLPTFLLTF